MAKSPAQIINLADVTQNPLRATHLKSDITNAVGTVVLLQIYASQAMQQANVDPTAIGDDGKDLLPSLIAHQTDAKRHANYLLQTVSPAVVTTLTDILAYGSMVTAFIDAILPLAPSVPDNPAARNQVLALLAQLDIEAGKRNASARTLAGDMAVALGQVQTDAKNLAADLSSAQALITSDKGELAKVQQQIDAIHNKIAGEIAGVVISALVVAAGGVVIAVGALATLPANVTATSVILAGVGLVVTGATGLTAAASLLASDNNNLASLYQQSAKLNLTLTLVGAITSQVKSVTDSASEVAEATGGLTAEWSSIREGIAAFRQDVTQATDATDVAHLVAGLKLAQQDWTAITQQAQSLLSRLVDLSPQQVDDILKTGTAG